MTSSSVSTPTQALGQTMANSNDRRTDDVCPDLTRYITLQGTRSVAEGGSSSIYAGTVHFKSGPVKVAIKVIRDKGYSDDPARTTTLQRRLRRESTVWYAFRHRNIIQLYGLAQDPAFSGVVSGLVFPWCENGTVLQFVQMYSDTRRIPLIEGVASGLRYIHNLNAVHGDIKSANILMSNDKPFRPLLTDFGCSKFLGVRGYTTELKTSIMYLAPELMDLIGVPQIDQHGKRKSGTPTTKETDVWAFSLVGAEIVGGSEVFRRIREYQLPSYIDQGGRPKKSDFPNISNDANIVWPHLEKCWSATPSERLTMGGFLRSIASS